MSQFLEAFLFGMTREEIRLLRGLKSPFGIQHFLDTEVPYNKEREGPTARSPRRVILDRTAHCFEGALFAAGALRVLGYPPLLLDLEAVRDDDHVLAVFRQRGRWGSIGKSNFVGLRFREPVYLSLRELAMSYFEDYYNLDGEKTLRSFSTRPTNLRRFDRIDWMTTEQELWEIGDYLCAVRHTRLLTTAMIRALSPMDERSFHAGQHGKVE
jgi:hypothetical protein